LRIPGVVTRSGVFEYRDSAGNVVREWRPPEEVLKADSIASMRDLPVTIRHPKGFVDPSSWAGLAIGHVSDPRADESIKAAGADIIVSRADAQIKVGTELKEISYGYRVRIDQTPGVVPAGMPDAGKAYDVVQRDIIGNHVALGPTGWGRQGSAVSLRLDSAGDECPPVETPQPEKKGDHMFKIRIDGKEFVSESEAGLQTQVDAHYAAKALEASVAAAATEKARADAAETVAAKLGKDLEAARADAAAAPAKVAARIALETEAKTLLGNSAKFDSTDSDGRVVIKTDREIRVEAIKKFDSAFSDTGLTDEAVTAAYSVWAKHGTKLAAGARVDSSSRTIASALTGAAPAVRADGTPADADPSDSDAAKARRRERNDSAPSAFTFTKSAADKAQANG
jgi:hypothetical protein